MPYFSTQPTGSVMEAAQRAVSTLGGGDVSAKDLIAADHAALTAGHLMAQTKYSQAMAEKARQEIEEKRKAGAARENPAVQAEIASDLTGVARPEGQRIADHIRGILEQPSVADYEDNSNVQPFPTELPPSVAPDKVNEFRRTIGVMGLGNIATGHSTADQLVQGMKHAQENSILAEAAAAARGGNVPQTNLLASGVLGKKELTPFKTNERGVTTNEWSGTRDETGQNSQANIGALDALAGQRDAKAALPGRAAGSSRTAGGAVPAASATPPAASAPVTAGAPLTGEEYLKTLPPGEAANIKSVAEGRVPLTSFSTKGGHRERVLQQVHQYDPTFNSTRAATWKEFTTGKAAGNITSINTSLAHIGTLDELADAMKNKDIPRLNQVINFVKTNTGKEDVNNFETARLAVGDELMRTFRVVGASEKESEAWQKRFAAANSPEQLKGAIKTAAELLKGRIDAVNDQWKRGTQLTTDFPEILSPKSRAVMERIQGGAKPKALPGGWSIKRID